MSLLERLRAQTGGPTGGGTNWKSYTSFTSISDGLTNTLFVGEKQVATSSQR